MVTKIQPKEKIKRKKTEPLQTVTMTVEQLSALMDKKLQESHDRWEQEAVDKAGEIEAARTKSEEELKAQVSANYQESITRMEEQSKNLTKLRGPVSQMALMNGLRYWVEIKDGEEQDVPGWLAYLIEQQREAVRDTYRLMSLGPGNSGAIFG